MESEITQDQINHSMSVALDMILNLGVETWLQEFELSLDRKKTILKNIEMWLIEPERERYEEAAIIRDGLDLIEQPSRIIAENIYLEIRARLDKKN
jgi:hypothetical protein